MTMPGTSGRGRKTRRALLRAATRETTSASSSISAQEGIEVASVHRAIGAERQLHVLLRHRLLRQPRGVEGLRGVGETLHVSDLPVAEAVQDGQPCVDRDAAEAHRAVKAHGDYNVGLARGKNLVKLDPGVIYLREALGHPLTHSRVAL